MTTRLSGRKTFFLPYNRDIENPPVNKGYRTKYLWEEILTPDSILDILQNFVHLANEEEYFFNEKTQKINKSKKSLGTELKLVLLTETSGLYAQMDIVVNVFLLCI